MAGYFDDITQTVTDFFTGEERSHSDDFSMSIETPRQGNVAFGDQATPVAKELSADTSTGKTTQKPLPLDKKLHSWKIGPRYEATSILGRGSYGEVAAGIDTLT